MPIITLTSLYLEKKYVRRYASNNICTSESTGWDSNPQTTNLIWPSRVALNRYLCNNNYDKIKRKFDPNSLLHQRTPLKYPHNYTDTRKKAILTKSANKMRNENRIQSDSGRKKTRERERDLIKTPVDKCGNPREVEKRYQCGNQVSEFVVSVKTQDQVLTDRDQNVRTMSI